VKKLKKYIVCGLIAILIIIIVLYFISQNVDNSYYELGEIAEVNGKIQDDGIVKYSALYELEVAGSDVGSAVKIEFYVQLNNETKNIENYDVKIEPIGSNLIKKNEFQLVKTDNLIDGLIELGSNKDELFTEYIDKMYYKRFAKKNSIEVLKDENKDIKENENNEKQIVFKVKNEWQGYFNITIQIEQTKKNKAIILIK